MSEEKSVKVYLTKEQYAEQVKNVEKIIELTNQLKTIAETFVSKTVKDAYQNSVKNLEKKNELYSVEKQILSPEEKKVAKEGAQKAIAEFRASQKKEVSEVSENATVPDDKETSTVGKKKKR